METRVVHVRSVPRPGHRAFWRGGHRWPVEGRTVTVETPLLAVLKRETMLAVDLEPSDSPEAGVLAYVDNYAGDREHNDARALREENEQLEARRKNLRAKLENERLKAEVAELEHQAELAKNADLRRQRGAIEAARERAALEAENRQLEEDLEAEKAEADKARSEKKKGK